MLVNNTILLIRTENTTILHVYIWLSRHIWIQLHLLWSSYLEATGSYLRNCPDFERKMTDPGQWSTVRCLETTRTTSQAVAPPAGKPLLHLFIKNGKKKSFSKLGFNHEWPNAYCTATRQKRKKNYEGFNHWRPNQLFKRKKKKYYFEFQHFMARLLVQISLKQLKRL